MKRGEEQISEGHNNLFQNGSRKSDQLKKAYQKDMIKTQRKHLIFHQYAILSKEESNGSKNINFKNIQK